MDGIIYLYDGEDMIKGRTYSSKYQRAELIKDWKYEIGNNFSRMAIQIAPAVKPDLVHIDGTNLKTKPRVRKQEEPKQELVRPKSEYNNLPTYKYD